ncbi:hypothetical protein CWB99_22860 [Pseudoalteromonas rubra]|uniref:Uncharacterized protein n=1 Tax=Pseudoalteromonas rubra TaxID=43658 RepID=A0A5S3WFH2_9GAMM|nr:hypothetical protein [Pseudoalteromonas rubra]TMP23962.1 hypothetical protein CWB99_22860 [Pseudoalteromonas rubra]TMP33350.1 hypothetical protein CWC00_10880 [Pseudoalteromonas rubra]
MINWFKNLLGFGKQPEPEFYIRMKGTTGFVTDVDSLFQSKVVKQQAELASKRVAEHKAQLAK